MFQREVCVKDRLVTLVDVKNEVRKMASRYTFNPARIQKKRTVKTNFVKPR